MDFPSCYKLSLLIDISRKGTPVSSPEQRSDAACAGRGGQGRRRRRRRRVSRVGFLKGGKKKSVVFLASIWESWLLQREAVTELRDNGEAPIEIIAASDLTPVNKVISEGNRVSHGWAEGVNERSSVAGKM